MKTLIDVFSIIRQAFHFIYLFILGGGAGLINITLSIESVWVSPVHLEAIDHLNLA